MRLVYIYRMKEEKTIFEPLTGIEPHIFGLLVRRVITTTLQRLTTLETQPVNVLSCQRNLI